MTEYEFPHIGSTKNVFIDIKAHKPRIDAEPMVGLEKPWETGFTSLEAETEGGFTTAPFTFTGGRLKINAWTRFRGEIQVEVVDATNQTNTFAGDIVAGRSFDDCDPITGHELLSHTVTWKGESDLSALAGRPVPTS